MIPESDKILASIVGNYGNVNIVKITDGWDSQVFVVNSRRVYKIPSTHRKGSPLKEHFLLKLLRPSLGRLVPSHPELYLYNRGREPIQVLSYDFIPGTTLESSFPVSDSEQMAIAVSFFRILQMIHSTWVPANRFLSAGSGLSSWKGRYAEMKARFTGENYPELQGNLIDYVQSLLSDFMADLRNFRFTPTFIHGDIDPRNIIWDRPRLCVAGLIDWAEADYGDPAFDAASLFFHEGLGLKYLKISGLAVNADAVHRIEFYHRLVPVYWIEYGYRNDDSTLIRKGTEELLARRNFSIRL